MISQHSTFPVRGDYVVSPRRLNRNRREQGEGRSSPRKKVNNVKRPSTPTKSQAILGRDEDVEGVGKEDDEGGDVLSPIYRTTNSSEIRAPRSEPSTVTRDICGTERNEVMRTEADVDEITAVVQPPN